jgi:hypothetical protein
MTIRPLHVGDLPRIGKLAESLVRAHHEYDSSRFIPLDRLRGNTYTAHVCEELNAGRSVVFVAEIEGRVIGYVFAAVEAESWKELRDEAGYVHDLVVDETVRRTSRPRVYFDGSAFGRQ